MPALASVRDSLAYLLRKSWRSAANHSGSHRQHASQTPDILPKYPIGTQAIPMDIWYL